MSLDALAIKCLTNEISEKTAGARIDKISQPEKDEIVIAVRTFTENLRLVISASAAHPRIHFTDKSKKNPKTAPMFCMLLRKHLGSGKITSVTQEGFERIVRIGVESYDELGELTEKFLTVEIMGRHSNIILTDSKLKIIDCIKHIDFTVNSVRQLLPGLQYTAPPAQDKIPLTDFSASSDISFDIPGNAAKAIMSAISGISPIVARETVYRALRRADINARELNTNQAAAVKVSLTHLAELANGNRFKPCMVIDKASGKSLDFSAVDIAQYEALADIVYFDTMSGLVDAFYSMRDMHDRMRQKSADITRLLNNASERVSKKLVLLKKTLDDAEHKDRYKICGDLITANMYRIERGASVAELENYYEDGSPKISVSLDPTLSPSQNAQRYYKKYNKAKTAETEAAKQLSSARDELEYLESTLAALENAENEDDLNAVRAELTELGYIKGQRSKNGRKSQKNAVSKPLHFISSDGFDIYVGKNNTQNDYLTLRFANSSDIWFHTKDIHGSHVIIKLGLDKNVPDTTVREAAELAAYHSKGRDSSNVPVDYTSVKNVRKPNGAKPGMVIYEHYSTIYATPALKLKQA